MEFLNVKNIIAKRQSLFAQQMEIGATIEQEKIWKLLELGNYAPSHRRTQPWRFSVFEKEAKNDFFETLASIYKSTTSKELFEEKKEQKILNKSKNVAVVIAICMKRCDKGSVPVFEEQWAVACAVQNILLGMKSLNIIGYWSTPKMAFSAEMKDYLNLENEDQCMGFLQLGIPKEGLPEIPKLENGPIEDKVTWI
ncbi:nitroreductase [bacterium]|nr:nitroreductase [bacterium]